MFHRAELVSVYAYTLTVAAPAFKLNSAVNHCEQSVIRTLANACARMNVGTALTNDDVACGYELTISSLYAQTLGLGVTAVLSGTHTFLMCKKLHTDSKHDLHLRKFKFNRVRKFFRNTLQMDL